MNDIPDPKIILPFPVDTDRIPFRERKKAQTFVHIAGNGGYMGRNGTDVVMQAIRMCRSEAKFHNL